MTPFAPEVLAALTATAKAVSLAPAALLALVSVETNGVAFASDGSPTILCEPAIYYRELAPGRRAEALKLGLAAKVWSRAGYADQGSEAGRRARCERMVAFDETAAYRSVSMGLGQIMGFNATHAGYATARDMYEGFRDLDAQARAIVAVLPALGVLEPLRRRDWVTVAVRYNGPGQRHNSYDRKLADAYAHWEFALASGQLAAPPEGSLGLWSRGPEVEDLQRGLNAAGLPIVADGVFGPKTAQAVASFQLRTGLPVTKGVADKATVEAVGHRRADPLPQGGREVATETDLKPRSRIVQKAAALRNGAMGAMGLGTAGVAEGAKDAAESDPVGTLDKAHAGINGALDKVDAANATWGRVKGLATAGTFESAVHWALAHPLPVIGGGALAAGAAVAVLSHQVVAARVNDHRTGATA